MNFWLKQLFVLLPSFLFAQVTFSEIMYDVSTNENHDEFVEIFNLSETDSIDITGWVFSDSSGHDRILPHRGGTRLAPRRFAVILDGSYFGNSTTYDSIIAPDVLILKVEDNSLGNSGLSNSRGEYLSIVDSLGDTLCTYRYSTGNRPGFSDEKVLLDGPDTAENWQDGLFPGGTPGAENSVSPRRIDPGFSDNAIQLPAVLFEDTSVPVTITVSNFGLDGISGKAYLQLFSDRNNDGKPGRSDLIIYQDSIRLSLPVRQDTQRITIIWDSTEAGLHRLIADLDYKGDERETNNRSIKEISVLVRENTLHINEIKFLTAIDEPEWVEIYNSGEQAVYLSGWAITDQVDTATIDTAAWIYPHQFKVIAADSLDSFFHTADSLVLITKNFPTLNNSEERILLLDPSGGWQEQVPYTESWLEGESGNISLERINAALYAGSAANWGPCVAAAGATPGERNSIWSSLSPRSAKLSVSPNPFSPDGDGFEDRVTISGQLPENSVRIKIQIYDILGRLIRTLHAVHFSGSRFDVVWDGKDGKGVKARMGIYIVFVQALNDRSGSIREMKTSVVLGGAL